MAFATTINHRFHPCKTHTSTAKTIYTQFSIETIGLFNISSMMKVSSFRLDFQVATQVRQINKWWLGAVDPNFVYWITYQQHVLIIQRKEREEKMATAPKAAKNRRIMCLLNLSSATLIAQFFPLCNLLSALPANEWLGLLMCMPVHVSYLKWVSF